MPMLYNDKQISAVSKELQRKFIAGECEAHDVVITLIALNKAGRIVESTVKEVMMNVFFHNRAGVLRALQKAEDLIDEMTINNIVSEVQATK